MATPGVVVCAGLWSALAFVLNLAWEIAHVRLYTIWAAADGMSVAWALLHCSLGDVVIALAMFALAGIVLRRADWPASRPWRGGVIVVIGYRMERMVQRLSCRQLELCGEHADDFRYWSFPAVAMADHSTLDDGGL